MPVPKRRLTQPSFTGTSYVRGVALVDGIPQPRDAGYFRDARAPPPPACDPAMCRAALRRPACAMNPRTHGEGGGEYTPETIT